MSSESEHPEEEKFKCCVYRLEGVDGYYYIGSTKIGLADRFCNHRSVDKRPKEQQQRVTQHFAELGWDKVKILSLHDLFCTRNELLKIEGELIKEHIVDPQCLNERITGRLETTQERSKRYTAERREDKFTCECGETILDTSMEYHLASEKHQNFMILKERPLVEEEYELCECGESVRRCNFAIHPMSIKHTKNIVIREHASKLKTLSLPHLYHQPKQQRVCLLAVSVLAVV